MDVLEVAPGLWRWTAPHPEWREGDDWPREVGCVYYEGRAAVVLIDPLVPPERDRFLDALDRDVERYGRPVAILLTAPWHARSAEELSERYGAAIGTEAVGVVGYALPEADETVYWLPSHAALVAGDALVGDGRGGIALASDSSSEPLRPLLELPVERVLVSHGEPVLAGGRAALAAALELRA